MHNRPSLLYLLLVAAVAGVILTAFRQHFDRGGRPSPETMEGCRGLSEEECGALGLGAPGEDSPAAPAGSPQEVLEASSVCRAVGYLCAEVERFGELRILRWPLETPRLRVWVPEPAGVSPGVAQELQRAAVRGIQAWDNHPFPLSISTRSVDQESEISVQWVRTLGENRLGQARMEWRMEGNRVEVTILGLALVTHHPNRPGVEISPEEIQLVAAHEMGHALGLPHSDDPRDLMYPQNTAWRPTQRDYRTMDALYRMTNGALIRK